MCVCEKPLLKEKEKGDSFLECYVIQSGSWPTFQRCVYYNHHQGDKQCISFLVLKVLISQLRDILPYTETNENNWEEPGVLKDWQTTGFKQIARITRFTVDHILRRRALPGRLRSSGTSANFYQTTRRDIQENRHLHARLCEKLKHYQLWWLSNTTPVS